jgi:hypothetical protein
MRALNLSHYEHEKVKYIKKENCLKKDVVLHGEGNKENWYPDEGYFYLD